MKNILRQLIVYLGKFISPSTVFLEKLLSISIMTKNYNNVFAVETYQKREELWINSIKNNNMKSFLYLEFGVWEGYSMGIISKNFTDPNCQFIGFDSFIGLPEFWDTLAGSKPQGEFSVDGNTPNIQDKRVEFVKGWFQNTLPAKIDKLKERKVENLVVHYDADLYSSTLFCLHEVDKLKIKYLAIFDELPGHETRALYNYQQSTGADVEFIGKVGPTKDYPWQVAAIITPKKEYIVE